MKLLVLGVLVALALSSKGFTTKTFAGDFDPIYKKYGAKYSVDWKLLKAVAIVESSENPNAINYSDPSYGLMQILFPNRLPSISDWPPPNANALLDPDYNIMIGAQILRWNITNYGYQRGIAIYNNWSARRSPANGPFPNEDYVDKVNRNVRKITMEGSFNVN